MLYRNAEDVKVSHISLPTSVKRDPGRRPVPGSARPLSDALRIAFVELIGWLVDDYGFSKPDAYQVVSQLAVVRVANMVDPLYTVVAKFPKRYLPPRDRPAAHGGGPGLRLGDLTW